MVFPVRNSLSSTDFWSKSLAGWCSVRWSADRVVVRCSARGTTIGRTAEVLVWKKEEGKRALTTATRPLNDARPLSRLCSLFTGVLFDRITCDSTSLGSFTAATATLPVNRPSGFATRRTFQSPSSDHSVDNLDRVVFLRSGGDLPAGKSPKPRFPAMGEVGLDIGPIILFGPCNQCISLFPRLEPCKSV